MMRAMAALAVIAVMQVADQNTVPERASQWMEYPPVLMQPDGGLPNIFPDSMRIGFHHVVFQFVVDTAGRVVPSTVRVLYATDSVSSTAVRSIVPNLRYVPAHLVEISGRCVRFNEGPLVCGGATPHVQPFKQMVELSVQYQ
jgi:hypothetical protein